MRMNYITHRIYKGPAANGQRVNVPYGTEFETIGDFIATPQGKGICFTSSDVAQRHFARNDDGRGLERGALTYAIAFRSLKGGSGYRFSDREIEMLKRHWSHWLRQDVDTILFNVAFFAAQPEDLQRLADALQIKVRR